MSDLTPREIVAELDRFIIGQAAAKRAVAVALRSRWRRRQLPPEMADEVYPKNILMIGPTGVGKTEISRRLAKLAKAPFLKVEATKFTEVGYVGRDVDSIIRDLVDAAMIDTRARMREDVRAKAAKAAEERVIEAIAGKDAREQTREMFRAKLRRGELDDTVIELSVADTSNPLAMLDPTGGQGPMGAMDLGALFKGLGGRVTRRRMTVAESHDILIGEEADKLLDDEAVKLAALTAVQENGIVFIDEIDKVAARADTRGADVSREGVQRDLLPLIEGTTVSTKHGPVKTDHILFIASGAFHIAKPSDLLPELQGRLPIRVELQALTEGDFVRILTETDNALTRQYAALLGTEKVTVTFTRRWHRRPGPCGRRGERIGREYRRAAAVHGDGTGVRGTVLCRPRPGRAGRVGRCGYVEANLGALSRSADLSRYVL